MARKALVEKQKKLNERRKRYLALIEECKKEGKPVPKVTWYSPSKYYNRCQITWRTNSYMRDFGVDRVTFRKYAREGKIMGLRKASW